MSGVCEKWNKFLDSATMVTLKGILKKLEIATTGNKACLKIRLQDAVKNFTEEELEHLIPDNFDEDLENDVQDNESDGDSNNSSQTCDVVDEDLDEELAKLQNIIKKKQEIAKLKRKLRELQINDEQVVPRSTMCSFRDMEEAMPAFSGDDTYPVRRWIEKFEESAEVFGLDEKSKFVYGKRLLTGTAKLFIRSVSLKSWNELKNAILEEFSKNVTVAEIHNKLRMKKKKREETVQQYVLEMQEIASSAHIDEEDLMYYIIKGIPDNDANKMMLYNANNMPELKSALRKYEKMKINNSEYSQQKADSLMKNKLSNTSYKPRQSNRVKCYNCNEMGHLSRYCNKERKTQTCFKCKKPGHTQATCNDKNTVMSLQHDLGIENASTDENIYRFSESHDFENSFEYSFCSEKTKYMISLLTLIDSGSPISFIQEQFVPICMISTVMPKKSSYVGINNSPLNVIGNINSKISFENSIVDLNLLVVRQNSMNYPVILGRNFITENNLVLQKSNKGRTNIKTKPLIHACNAGDGDTLINKNNDEDVFEIMNIEVSNEKSEMTLKVNNKLPFSIQNKVHEIVKPAWCNSESQVSNYNDDFKMKILLTKQDPFFCTPRRLPYSHKLELEKMLKDLLDKKIIRESNSPYASPIVLVNKKNGELRLCVDFRELNKVTIKDNFPLPVIEDHLDRLKDKRYFTTLDLKQGFHHVKIDDDSIKYTSFITPLGQYEYLRMPFGLKNAPSVFERYMRHLFSSLTSSGEILTYIDDILIATETLEEHLSILEKVIKIVRENCLNLRFDKCLFLQNDVVYLGYRVNEDGIRPNDDHLQAVRDFPVPTCTKDVHSFLGLCSYFRKFIKDFACIARPLYDLLKKDVSFVFGPKEYKTFELLKKKLVESPVLCIYSPQSETELHCDASSVGFGAVLLQKQKDQKFHPIFYFSKRATDSESKFHSYELETLAIIYALRRFRIYLVGIDFKIITDCQALTLTLNKKILNSRISRWALELQAYSYGIEHRSGERMQHADALSRSVNILSVSDESFEFVLAATQRQDPKILEIVAELEKNESAHYEMIDGLVYRKSKDNVLFYVPKHMENAVIRTHHEKMCHVGVEKCFEYLSRTYWFPEMKSKIKKLIKSCLKCIYYSPNSGKTEGTLHSIPKGNAPFDTLHVDHFGPLANTKSNKKHVFLIIDGFTKFVKLYAVRTTASKEAILCLQKYFENYSRPNRIISDRGTCFTSDEFQNFIKENNINHVKVAVHSPQSNGQVERINRVLTPMLAKECESSSTSKWDIYLAKVEFALNNTVNRSTGFSPSMILFGRNQKGEFCDKVKEYLEENLGCDYKKLDDIRNQAAENNEKTQIYNKAMYDKKHKRPVIYRKGDYVMIKNIANVPGVNKKLHAKYRGPYEVYKALPNDRYLIKDIDGMQLTRVPYKSVCSPDNMRPFFVSDDHLSDIHESKV